jgi:hypothetical protein
MTHTYLKQNDGYEIGQWLINREGHHQFIGMFKVANLGQAFAAVNTLNGGTRLSPEQLHVREKE